MDALRVEDVSLSIGESGILDGVSFSLEKGSFSAMCGHNGAGKSQLLRIIKGLARPSSGRILLDGRECSAKERMRRVGLVFQDAQMQMVAQSVEKDIAFGPENLGLDSGEVSRRVGMALALMGLEAHAKQRPQTLSGGELRKTAIAGVLAMEPDVILMDEPFANLDYPSTLTVIRSLLDLHEKGFTILVVSHEAEKFLSHADRLIVMSHGRVVVDGTACDEYHRLVENDIYIPPAASFEDLTWLA